MPAFSAIALDRLLEPGASKSPSPSPSKKRNDYPPERRNTAPFPPGDLNSSAARRHVDIPPAHPKLRRRNSVSSPAEEKKVAASARPQISPALYATPESTPLPDDSPTSSFPPSSPYIINHKRRGPRLLKSFSYQYVASAAAAATEEKTKVEDDEADSKPVRGHFRSHSVENVTAEQKEELFSDKSVNGNLRDLEVQVNGSNCEIVAQEIASNGANCGEVLVEENVEPKVVVGSSSERDAGEMEDFFDPQESLSFTSNTDGEDFSADRSAKMNTPMGEFFDAWEELSSDNERQPQRCLTDIETELREMRLSLLMEIEKRKQAEEALNSMRRRWQLLVEMFRAVGLILPADIPASSDDNQSANGDPTEDICRQIHLARFVSESIGRGTAKAEAEAEMEAQLETKNFEIARLCDRLHYYETMNREMSQRNQEAIEIARRERQKRRRRQRWVWGSIAAAITLGSAALAWSYLPSGKGSSLNNYPEASEPSTDAQ